MQYLVLLFSNVLGVCGRTTATATTATTSTTYATADYCYCYYYFSSCCCYSCCHRLLLSFSCCSYVSLTLLHVYIIICSVAISVLFNIRYLRFIMCYVWFNCSCLWLLVSLYVVCSSQLVVIKLRRYDRSLYTWLKCLSCVS